MLTKTEIEKAESQSLANENSLQIYIRRAGLNEIEAMNSLMNAGLVSDNAVMARDVASQDCFAACLFLQKQRDKKL